VPGLTMAFGLPQILVSTTCQFILVRIIIIPADYYSSEDYSDFKINKISVLPIFISLRYE
jgi:hypothetical protein